MAGSVEETPLLVPVGDERLFGVLHRPQSTPRGGFVFCHAFAEEKLWAHRVFVSFARRLAAGGWTVLRVDFRGHGDSDRSFEQSDVTTQLEDTRAALATLRRELPPDATVGVLGLRFGATIAALVAAERHSHVDRLILWDPVVKGDSYMQTVLRANLAFQMALHKKVVEDRDALITRMRSGDAVNVEGYGLSLAYFEQARAIDLVETVAGFPGRGLVVQIGPASAPMRKDLTELSMRCGGLRLAQAEEEPFWKEIKTFYQRADRLAEVTERWIEETS